MQEEHYIILIEILTDRLKELKAIIKQKNETINDIKTENARLNQIIKDLESRK